MPDFKAPSQKTGSLLNFGNAKTPKGETLGFATAIMYLAPAMESGTNMCSYASKGCTAACLFSAGHGAFQMVIDARVKRTLSYLNNLPSFMLQLESEIERFVDKAIQQSFIPVVRLNGTSDALWERVKFVAADGKSYASMMNRFPTVQFYDYTKVPLRYRKNRPGNYDLTFSLSEDNDAEAQEVLDNGGRVAVVFKSRPTSFMGVATVDGDASDARFNDPANAVVSLKAKGKARKDTSGFVRDGVSRTMTEILESEVSV